MEKELLIETLNKLNKGEKVALVILTFSQGSTPRKSGAMMCVYEDGKINGSIGGGIVEANAIKKAQKCLLQEYGEEFEFDLNSNKENSLDVVCGGKVRGYVKILLPNPQLIIMGGGHISRELCLIGKNLDFDITVWEDRNDFLKDDVFSGVKKITGNLEESNLNINKNCYVVIATRGHLLDKEALIYTLKYDYKYLGMLGSKSKINKLIKEVKEELGENKKIKEIYTPIGLDISDGTPKEML